MIDLKCPSCNAPYQLAKSRVPEKGLRMRCPKCTAIFRVMPDGQLVRSAETKGAVPSQKRTMQGVAPASVPPSAVARPSTLSGTPGGPVPRAMNPPSNLPAAKGALSPVPGRKLAVPSDLPAPIAATSTGRRPPSDLPAFRPAPPAPRGAPPPVAATPRGQQSAHADRAPSDLPAFRPAPPAQRGAPPPVAVTMPRHAPTRAGLPGEKAFEDIDLPAARFDQTSPFAPGVLARRDSQGSAPDRPSGRARPELSTATLVAPAEAPEVEIDVPADGSFGTPFDAFDDLDLPMPKSEASRAPHGVIDLPGVPGAFADLPAPMGLSSTDNAFGELDLPAPLNVDLPAPRGGFADLPGLPAELPVARDPFGDLDPRVPRAGDFDADLPELLRSDLPVPRQIDLPAPQAPGGGLLDLPIPQPAGYGSELPVPRAPGGGVMDLPMPSPLPPSGGGADVAFGHIDLGDEMEFDALPQERPSRQFPSFDPGLGLPSDLPAPPTPETSRGKSKGPDEAPEKKRLKLSPTLAAVVLVSLGLIGAGAALGTTRHGYFGIYFLEQFLPSAGSDQKAQSLIAEAEKQSASDSYDDTRRALKILAEGRRNAGLNRRLLARSLLHESLFQLRFGAERDSGGRAARILARLQQRGFDAPNMDVAQAAHALQQADATNAAMLLARAPDSDPMVHLVAGEIALQAGRGDDAVTHFERAVGAGLKARGTWGLARAQLLRGDMGAAEAAVDATLATSLHHAAAMTEKARLVFAGGSVDDALQMAQQVTALAGSTRVGPREQAEAWALVGRLHEARGERPLARKAYEHALELDDFVVDALLGAGRLFLTEGRYRDALARFQAVVGSKSDGRQRAGDARPIDVEARLGAAKALIALGEANDARPLLQELASSGTHDAEVVLYLGKVAEAVSDVSDAERNYREAIRLAPDSFDPYLALAELFLAQDNPGPAEEILAQAEKTLDESAAMRSALGRLKFSQNDLAGAAQEYQRARTLSPADPATLFGLGVTLRRLGRFPEAEQVFAELAAVDNGWTGLSLERGRVYEAQGQGARAVTAYEEALAEHPDNTDLELRLGAALVAVGRIDEGEARLQKVLTADPNVVEAQHYMGRVFFERGDLSEAMTYFSRAVAIDGSRAEFHLYVAWTAFEQGKLSQAFEEVEAAIQLDPTLADAFWLRAKLRAKTGAARDAIKDLEQAMRMRPEEPEFLAALGDANEQLRRLGEAVEAYTRALAADPSQGRWWYRLGQLQMDSGRQRDAAAALARATHLGDAGEVAPAWLADAHRLEGDAARLAGDRRAAEQHYRRYLELAGDSAIDRAEVERRLDQWSPSGTVTLR